MQFGDSIHAGPVPIKVGRRDMLIEPSSAVPLGALLEKKIDTTGKRIGIILSGGNIDPEKLSLKG